MRILEMPISEASRSTDHIHHLVSSSVVVRFGHFSACITFLLELRYTSDLSSPKCERSSQLANS
jgi:hypothetical protein